MMPSTRSLELLPDAPVPPWRTVLLPAVPAPEDEPLLQRGRALLLGRASDLGPPRLPLWQGWEFSRDKADVMIRIIDALVRHYALPGAFDSWLLSLARREHLGSTGVGGGVALLDFRMAPLPEIDDPLADWWLFLNPDGIEWQAIDGRPVQLLLLSIFRLINPIREPRQRPLEVELQTRVLRRLADRLPATLPRRPREAARWFNGVAACVIEDRRRGLAD